MKLDIEDRALYLAEMFSDIEKLSEEELKDLKNIIRGYRLKAELVNENK